MIVEYHRPDTLEAALDLLAREIPPTYPLGGGTVINRPGQDAYAVVDLQKLGLDQIIPEGNWLKIGAMARLQGLAGYVELPPALARAIRLELPVNLRQLATAAGQLVAADGRSPFATAMLAMDARLLWKPGDNEVGLGDWLLIRGMKRSAAQKRGGLILSVRIPTSARLAFETIGRTPEDRPLVCLAAALWPSGRTRIALGGYGAAPVLAMDGPEPGGVEAACVDAYSQAGDDWASAEYRAEIASVLASRALAALTNEVEQP